MKRIIIFASGSGSNAEEIMKFFSQKPEFEIGLVVSNNPLAGVIERAKKFNVPVLVSNDRHFFSSKYFFNLLQFDYKPDLIVLAGYLWLIPEGLIERFPKKIINIHPALLPKYGGKGMYGDKVHEAVILNKEKESGVTIHYVNKNYDEGNIIYQESFRCSTLETVASLKEKIHQLEHKIYPNVIQQILT